MQVYGGASQAYWIQQLVGYLPALVSATWISVQAQIGIYALWMFSCSCVLPPGAGMLAALGAPAEGSLYIAKSSLPAGHWPMLTLDTAHV